MIIATAAALNLRQLLVRCKGLMFLQSSRFSKEALENLFSAMEVKSPVLRAREFKYTLGLVMLAQLFVFLKPSKHSSYINYSVHLTEFF